MLGCAAAYQLARRGVDVLLVERAELNREASGSNAGTLHVQMPGKHFRLNYDGRDLTQAERDHVCAHRPSLRRSRSDVGAPSNQTSRRTSGCGATVA